MSEVQDHSTGGLTIRIDRLICVGFGDCIEASPEAFELDDEGIAVFRDRCGFCVGRGARHVLPELSGGRFHRVGFPGGFRSFPDTRASSDRIDSDSVHSSPSPKGMR